MNSSCMRMWFGAGVTYILSASSDIAHHAKTAAATLTQDSLLVLRCYYTVVDAAYIVDDYRQQWADVLIGGDANEEGVGVGHDISVSNYGCTNVYLGIRA